MPSYVFWNNGRHTTTSCKGNLWQMTLQELRWSPRKVNATTLFGVSLSLGLALTAMPANRHHEVTMELQIFRFLLLLSTIIATSHIVCVGHKSPMVTLFQPWILQSVVSSLSLTIKRHRSERDCPLRSLALCRVRYYRILYVVRVTSLKLSLYPQTAGIWRPQT